MLFRRPIICLFVFMVVPVCSILAQVPSYIHFDVSSGLPSNEIYSMHQDAKGFLWIGTDAGLVRYDGNIFFLLNNPNSRGVSVSGLKEDREGKIWFNNFSGQIFYAKGDSIYLFRPWEKYYKSQLADFTIDNNNDILINNNENFVYRFKNQQDQVVKLVDSINTKRSVAKMMDGKIIIRFLNKAELYSIEPDNSFKELPVYELDGTLIKKSRLLDQFLFYNSFLNKQTLGVQRRNPNDKKPYLFYYKNAAMYVHPATTILQKLNMYPLSVYDDDKGNLFVGTEQGLLWIKKNDKGYYLQSYFLKNDAISSIIKTTGGSIWISTLKNGIYQIPNLNIWTSGGIEMGLKSEGISHLAIGKKGELYAASVAGEIFRYQKFNKISSIQFMHGGAREVQVMEYDSVGNNLYVSKLITDIYNVETKQYTQQNFGSSSKDYFFRKDGVIFSSGSVLVASVKNNPKLFEKIVSGEFKLKRDSQIISQRGNYLNAIIFMQRNKGIWYQENEKTLWVGFVDGLRYFENHEWKMFYDPTTNQPIIAFHFSEFKDGTLCIATINQGLYLVKGKKIVLHLTQQNGLLSNRIKRVRTDDDAVWMVMPGAIQGYRTSTHKFTKLVIANNTAKEELYDVAILRDTVYLATSRGIQFFPETIETINKEVPNILINSFNVDGKNLNTATETELLLPYAVNAISITLQGISIKSSGAFIYQYRLVGSDTNWVNASASQNIVRYASLPSGKYTFEARVLNEDGYLSKTTPRIRFTIDEQWWKKWWLLLIASVILMGGIYFYFLSRINYFKKKNLEEIEKVRVREEVRNSQLSALKAQMNPHFIFNVLNSIQEIVLLNDKRQANSYLGKFADLMRMTLDQSSKIAISLDDELRSLKLYLELESLRFEENFTYEVRVTDMLYTFNILIPAMLIQPYVENAIKHGLMHLQGEKKLELSFSLFNDNTLLCVITDNGIGRRRSAEINRMREKKHTSFATGATQRRLELLNQGREQTITVSFVDLVDAKGQDNGTKVLLYIPLIS